MKTEKEVIDTTNDIELRDLARENGYNDAVLEILEKITLLPEQKEEILKLYKR